MFKAERSELPWRAGYLPRRLWTNPFAAPLPHAPSLQVYCMHGTNVVTDRSFHLTATADEAAAANGNGNDNGTASAFFSSSSNSNNDNMNASEPSSIDTSFPSSPSSTLASALPFTVDERVDEPQRGLEKGVQTVTEGDGTLTSLSLGYPCARLWRGVDQG